MTNETAPDEGNCFSDGTKRCCATYVYWISFLMFLLCIAMGAYGYVSINGADFKPQVGEYKVKWNVPSNMAFAYLLIAGAVFALIVSVLGFLTSQCKSCFVAVPLGLISFLAGLLAVIAGVGVFAGNYTNIVKNEVCGDAVGGANFVRSQYKPYVDQLMCTSECTCSDIDGNLKSAFSDAAQKVNRTAALVYGGNLTTYRQCFKLVENTKGNETNQNAEQFFKKGGFQFLESFENQYKCAGLCYTPLFYLTRPLTDGPPTQSCDTAFINSVTGNAGVGGVAIVTGLVLLSMFVGSIPLCSGFASDGDAMGNA